MSDANTPSPIRNAIDALREARNVTLFKHIYCDACGKVVEHLVDGEDALCNHGHLNGEPLEEDRLHLAAMDFYAARTRRIRWNVAPEVWPPPTPTPTPTYESTRCPYCDSSSTTVITLSPTKCFVMCNDCNGRGPTARTAEEVLRLWKSRAVDTASPYSCAFCGYDGTAVKPIVLPDVFVDRYGYHVSCPECHAEGAKPKHPDEAFIGVDHAHGPDVTAFFYRFYQDFVPPQSGNDVMDLDAFASAVLEKMREQFAISPKDQEGQEDQKYASPTVYPPCPFCGFYAWGWEEYEHPMLGKRFYAECPNCLAKGPRERTEQEAIDAWVDATNRQRSVTDEKP